ncbi:MAG: ATP-binding protein, partial [Acidobacteriota bacterium]
MKQNSARRLSASSTAVSGETGINVLLNNIFDLFGTLDPEGRVISLEGRIFEKTNTDTALLLGQRFYETVFWQTAEVTSKLLERSIRKTAGGEVSELVLDFRISADEKQPVEVHFQPVVGPDGATNVFFCAKQVKEPGDAGSEKTRSEQLLFAAENAEIGLWYWDFGGDTIYSTPRCNELLGLPPYDAITIKSFLNCVHPDDRDYASKFLKGSRAEGAKYEEEFRVERDNGLVDWIAAAGRSFLGDDGRPIRMVGVLRKITEEKLAAADLAKVYDREKRARDEAVEANRAKDFFLAFVSHELRSPLNAILGWAKILLTREVDEATRRNALETIERSALVQTKLINDLVDSARVASGKLRLEYHLTDLNEVVRVSFNEQKPSADAQDVKFECILSDEQITVFGDSGRLQQVFTNLLSNAIKFTPAGGSVAIKVQKNAETVSVSVSDTGRGISPEALPRIFRQFSQGETSRDRNNTGLGLGLSIVKILVTKHRGTVSAHSEGIGEGAEFTVTLPLSESTIELADQDVTSVPQLQALRGLQILIVEDDPDSREVLQLFLEQSGAVVVSADSAIAAMELLRRSRRRTSVIISDLAMPGEDGYTFLSKVRKLPDNEGGETPAIALSAFATVESKQKAFES